MKSGSKNRKTLKLVGATSVTLFSLVSVFAASIAWFSMNTEANNNGMNLNVDPSSGRLNKVYFHAFNDDADDDGLFEFNKTPYATYTYNWTNGSVTVDKAGSLSDWELEDYTAFDHDHPILIIFELDNDYESTSAGDIFVKGHTTVNGYLGARDGNGDPVYDLNNLELHNDENPTALVMKQETVTVGEQQQTINYFAFSSVAAFRNQAFSDDEYTAFLAANTGDTLAFKTEPDEPEEPENPENPENTEEEEDNAFLHESEPFCDVDNTAETYSFNQNPFLYKSDGESTVKYIAVIIEYSADAIGYIYSTYLGDRTLESWENILHFTCDWSLEVY